MNNQEKILEYNFLLKHLQQLQQNTQAIHNHLEELKNIQENFTQLATTPPGTETLIPLGSGLFFKGKTESADNILINVGANILVEKTIPQAMETIQKQFSEIEQLLSQLEEEAGKLTEQLENVRREMKE